MPLLSFQRMISSEMFFDMNIPLDTVLNNIIIRE